MKLHEHLIASLIFFITFWGLVAIDFFGKLKVQFVYESHIEFVPSLYYWIVGVIMPDIDLAIMKIYPKLMHRNIVFHSFIWAIPAFFEHTMAAGMLCFTLGLHLWCDITRTLGRDEPGHFQEVHWVSKPLGKGFSILWFICNGTALIIIGIGFMLV